VPFGVTYEKIGTIQRRLAWPLHKDDTLSRSGSSTELNIYFLLSFSLVLFLLGLYCGLSFRGNESSYSLCYRCVLC
ncbi:hypothetical protein BJ165DRAFT_1344547, partial [Panaeolus papilionaceus]